MTEEFTLPLAILDFVPVLLTGIGFIYIVRMVYAVLPTHGRTVFLGGLLVVAGGFLRALWKLLIVVSGGKLVMGWMGDSLFVLMAPGFILSACGIWQFVRFLRSKKVFNAWMIPLLLVVMTWGAAYFLAGSQPDTTAWKGILISSTVLGNLIAGLLLIIFAFAQGLSKAAWLFLVNLVMIFISNGLARVEQTILIHWAAESVNTISCLCYAVAARMVYEYMVTNFSGEAAVHLGLMSTAGENRV